ncbi:ATP-binding cassette domain-containing protein [Spiroplasma turonicum]|uniref:ABC transporter ATP-binding protein n=1 Tax=Spiroplasma turonicum TaxID=216946 RepID=A0A0K1P5X2_9MOLU|nr:ABC transporter ATP-binding protein [Spiroplasma turonicum]AKU79574.1 ABC transporter ATP-binding protein [Spiroplasma turonicum]ALX70597.1 ABC transporter ATP-binding protein [Spiroplasma turonicum]
MIEVKNITKLYKNNDGIKNVSFNLKESCLLSLIGENGAGKTTTIKAIFKEAKLDSGKILIDGDNLHTNNNLRKIAFFPDSNNIPLNIKSKDYINYICATIGLSKKAYKDNLNIIVDLLKINNLMNKKIKELSAGQKKKIIMASVLIREPKYIFFDEPTANLDISSKTEFISIIKYLKNLKISMLITSHLLDELQEISDHIVILNKGSVVYNQSFDSNKENIKDLYNNYISSKKIQLEDLNKVFKSK